MNRWGRHSSLLHQSGKKLLDDVALDVGQAIVATLELVGQTGVIDAEAVQQRRVQVVDVDRPVGDVVTEVVGGAVADSPLDASPRQPDGEAARVVVAAVVGGGQRALAV